MTNTGESVLSDDGVAVSGDVEMELVVSIANVGITVLSEESDDICVTSLGGKIAMK